MRQVDQLSLQANLTQLQQALALGNSLYGHISNGADDVEHAIKKQGVEADLDWKFIAIPAPPHELQSHAHWPGERSGEIALPVGGVGCVKALREEQFEQLPQQFGACIAKDGFGLPVHHHHGPGRIDDHQGIR